MERRRMVQQSKREYLEGDSKFQVQRVHDDASAHRLPGAWQSRGIASGACSTDGRWHSAHAAVSPIFPSIIGQRCAQQRGHMLELLGEALAGTLRIRSRHPGQDDQAGRTLHQGPDCRPMGLLRRSLSRWPSTVRVATSAGCSGNGRHGGDLPRRSVPCARGRHALCV